MAVKTDISGSLSFLDGRRAEMTTMLETWCSINTHSYNLSGLAEMRDLLAKEFASLEADVEFVATAPQQLVNHLGEIHEKPLGACLRVTKRPQAQVRVLLAGHMDTVFPADHPFQRVRRLDGERLNAPGAADMKGGLLAMLYALKAVEASPFADRIGYEVLINADEEIGSPGSAAILHEAAKRAQFACVYEPALEDGTLVGARKGSGNFAAVIRGRSAHAGRDHDHGRNAVVAAAEFALRASGLSGLREGLTVNVARIDGGAPNNVVPDVAVTRFNVRVDLAEDAEWVEGQLNSYLNEIRSREGFASSLHGGFGRPPKPMTPPLKSFLEALASLARELGVTLEWKSTGGVCDGNNIAAAGVPVVDTLGVRGAHIHSAAEYACLDSLEERAKLSALLLLRVAAGDIPNPGAARSI